MCHQSVLDFVRDSAGDVTGKTILEVGSYDVNGSPRQVLTGQPAEYLGVDLCACDHGHVPPCVDVVQDYSVEGVNREFDLVICTEVLEHVPRWRPFVTNLKASLRMGGTLIVTSRGPGWPFHPHPGDYWRFTADDMRTIFADLDIRRLVDDPAGPGVLLAAAKPEPFRIADLTDYHVADVHGNKADAKDPSKVFIGIPILNRLDLLERCLAHIDVPAEVLVINNNAHDQEFNDGIHRLAETKRFDLRDSRYNLGVAASWNQILMHGFTRGHQRVFIMANDLFLHPGSLRTAITLAADRPGVMMIDYYNAFSVNLDTVRRVGLFDERFYPAYYEDVDYTYRCGLAGVPVEQVPGAGGDHLGSQTIRAEPRYAQRNHDTFNHWNHQQYLRKWGGVPGQERYCSPFNLPEHDYRWTPAPENLHLLDWDRDLPKLR